MKIYVKVESSDGLPEVQIRNIAIGIACCLGDNHNGAVTINGEPIENVLGALSRAEFNDSNVPRDADIDVRFDL